MDSLAITDLELWTPIGVPEEERLMPQRVLLTIRLSLDTKVAAREDNFQKSVDYQELAERMKRLAETPRRTIERLAEDVAAAILGSEKVSSVEVTVTKFPPVGAASVGCTVRRP